jgi:phage minor structural protein
MFPILYDQITAGVVPQHNGLGVLSDCVSCYVEQSRNSKYELTMVYMASGIHASEIAERRILKVKPNFTDDPQLFRIDRIGKTMNGRFTVYGKHISYDLNGYEITQGTANTAVAACALLQSAATGYTFTTDKTVDNTFKIGTPASVRSYFAGRSGSFVDVFGTTEIKYDNFNVQFLLHAGADRNVTIRYGKNLLELSQEIDSSNLYTDVLCFYKNGEDDAIVGNKVSTGLVLDVPKTLVLDVTSEFDSEPSVGDLTGKALDYRDENNLTVPNNNIKLDFAQSGELTGRVDLCDTVSIYYEALGITRSQVKCIRTKWDCINEKYVETEFGDVKGTITETISVVQKEVAEKPSSTQMGNAIDHATKAITGNLGGYVINGHDTNNDGLPDENLIMDTQDIATATKVIRSNLGGIGFSKTGYTGQYTTAIDFNGINASSITTGTLNADLIKAGTISDAAGHSEIDMTDGVAKLWLLNAIKGFNLLSQGDEEVRSSFEALQFATQLILSPDDAENNPFMKLQTYRRQADAYSHLYMSNDGSVNTVELTANSTGGYLALLTKLGKAVNVLSQWQYGADCYHNNANGDTRIHEFVGGNDDGVIQLKDGNNNTTINLAALNGLIECGQVRPSGLQQVELWNASHTTGTLSVPWGFNNYILVGKVSGGGSFLTMTIPRAVITDTDQRFQFTDEADYYVFDARKDVDPDDGTDILLLTYVNRSGSGSIQKVYGSYT